MGDAARKLLEKMRASPSGWGQSDFERLFQGFGFAQREGGSHTIYTHPEYPGLRMSVPRHNDLREWVARDSVKLIDELLYLQSRSEDGDGLER